MQPLRIRCLGGLELRLGEEPLESFESQKVRALLTYLACQRHRTFDREHLAGLLWPEKTETAARRNLRQALYNLKQVLAPEESSPGVVTTVQGQIGFHPELDCWIDVEAFEGARTRGLAEDRVEPHYLAEAAGLYRGEFLAGFSLRDSSAFEQWCVTEQRRLREAAIEILHALIESYLSRGELRLGTRFAHRLVAIDPLSESAHRYLIQLYGFSGRRQRALNQYEQLRDLLQRELQVEPEEQTQRVLDAALSQQEVGDPVTDEPVGPLLPMVGRGQPYRQLEAEWKKTLAEGNRLTIVEGEPGVGKTRLVRSFLDAASARSRLLVLKSKCDDIVPTAYQPVVELLRNAIAADTADIDWSLHDLSPRSLAALALLLPEIGLPAGQKLAQDEDDLFAGFVEVLMLLGRRYQLLVLFLDDLHRADEETITLLTRLLERQTKIPLWMIATCQPAWDQLPSTGSRISVARLDAATVEEVASDLVAAEQVPELARFLYAKSQGLPVLIAEWINLLWDEGALRRAGSRWQLSHDLADSLSPEPLTVDGLISNRLLRLPSSTRRIAVLASIVGHAFDAELLRQAENEHPSVVDLGLQILLEKWLLQKQAPRWSTAEEEQELEPMPHGIRHGRFEFSHRRIRRAVYRTIAPERRRYLHLLVASKIEAERRPASDRSEQLAYHYSAAGCWREALEHLREAAHNARRLAAFATADRYLVRALEVISQALEETEHPQAWHGLQAQLEEERAALRELRPT